MQAQNSTYELYSHFYFSLVSLKLWLYCVHFWKVSKKKVPFFVFDQFFGEYFNNCIFLLLHWKNYTERNSRFTNEDKKWWKWVHRHTHTLHCNKNNCEEHINIEMHWTSKNCSEDSETEKENKKNSKKKKNKWIILYTNER